MKRWVRRGAVVAALVAVAFVLKLTVLAPKPVPVTVVDVQPGRVEETVTNSRAGTVKAARRAQLSPEAGGEVVELPFREGDRVQVGAVLLRLDDSSQRASLALARREADAAGAERDRSCLAAARSNRELERSQHLADDGILSADQLDGLESAKQGAEAACRAAEANFARALAAVSVAEAELAKTVILAPFDGVVAEVSIELGEWTTPSPPAIPVPPVIDLLDPSSIYISAPMDEVDSARIGVGQPVRVTVDSHRGESFAGHVRRVAPYVLDVQEQNRTVEVEVDLEDPDLASELLPGTSADIEIILRAHDDVLRLPSPALMEGNRVLVFAGGVLEERQIEPGIHNWDFTEVLDGLAAGDRVVSSLDRAEVVAGAKAVVADEP